MTLTTVEELAKLGIEEPSVSCEHWYLDSCPRPAAMAVKVRCNGIPPVLLCVQCVLAMRAHVDRLIAQGVEMACLGCHMHPLRIGYQQHGYLVAL